MNYAEVLNILGCEGQVLSNNNTTVTFQWKGNSPKSNLKITFQDGRLTNKMQTGLK